MPSRSITWLFLSLLGSFVQIHAWAQEGDLGFHVTKHQTETRATVTIRSDYDKEFTVTLTAQLNNAVASPAVPFTVDARGRRSFRLAEFRPKGPGRWRYNYHYDVRSGGRRDAKTNDAIYLLPFLPGSAHRVIQGYFGAFSHYQGSGNEYAIDWQASTGTIICAARAGRVVGLRQDSNIGGRDEKFKKFGNYVLIKHEDGTFAEYYHIQYHGALVHLDANVAAGKPIAKSGATGHAAGPHLHFAVFQTIDGKTRLTLPIRFKTDKGIVDEVQAGQTYTVVPIDSSAR